MSDSSLQGAEGLILMLVIVAYVLRYAVKRLGRSRPGFTIGRAVFVAGALRFFSVLAINAAGLSTQLRGGDENTFLDYARSLAAGPFGTGFLPQGRFQLQTD